MALFLRQDDTRSKLQTRLSKDLQGKLDGKLDITAKDVEPEFLSDNHTTKTLGMVFAAVVVLLIVGGVILLLGLIN